MSDIINKDNINNKLNDDGTEKPLKKRKSVKPKKVKPENTNVENVIKAEEINAENKQELIESIDKQELTESVDKQELTESVEKQELIESVEKQELLESGDKQELLEAGEKQELLESGDKTEEVTAEDTNDVVNKEEIESANSKDSNYQVSLIDERILKVRTSTNQSVSIDCNLIIKEEIQSNKIFLHPRAEEEKQEIEVVVIIGESETPDSENTEEDKETSTAETAPVKKRIESNYQVSLINENVLRIKISTNKSVSVDCSILDKTTAEEGEETQTNKIYIKPKHGIGKQDVAIFIKLGSEIYKDVDNAASSTEVKKSEPFHQSRLIPNPLVADLINKFSKPKEEVNDIDIDALTPEERLELKIGRKNPWRRNKEFLARNLYRGFVSANIIAIVAMILFYAFASKKPKDEEIIEQRRLIVMQDLPENLNQLNQNVDDPNKPEPPEDNKSTDGSDITPPVITPKKIRPPRVNLPTRITTVEKDSNDSAINKELDSLRKKNITGNKGDTGVVNTSLMPDSLLRNLSANEVGLIGRFPPNWKQIDARTINQKDEFLGILLVDTAVKKEETMTMNIELDAKGEKFNQFQFKKVFDEDSLRTVYSIDPKQEGKMTFYRFYVANKTDNVFINAYVVQSAFEKYKPEIERVVKTVRIQRPEKK